jgi:hypothetical protein
VQVCLAVGIGKRGCLPPLTKAQLKFFHPGSWGRMGPSPSAKNSRLCGKPPGWGEEEAGLGAGTEGREV